MNVEIRAAEEGDARALFEIYRANMRMPAINLLGEWNNNREWAAFEKGFLPAANHLVVAGEHLLGYFQLQRAVDHFALFTLQITPPMQGHGLGSQVLSQIQELARTEAIPIQLEVLKETPAAGWFAKRGFEPVSQQQKTLLMKWVPASDSST